MHVIYAPDGVDKGEEKIILSPLPRFYPLYFSSLFDLDLDLPVE